jgi:rhamnulokinase
MQTLRYYLAVDLGASSGKMILGHVEDGRIILEEVHRFDNNLVEKNGRLCWDLENLFDCIVQGLKNCKAAGKIPQTLGIDTWGVDFVLLDRDYNMLGDSVAYRDRRNEGMDEYVEARISEQELYSITGIQKQQFNTIYQLAAVKKENPEHLEQAEYYLMIPDYLHFLLTGVCKNEYTIASTTGLLNAHNNTWDSRLLEILDYPKKLFRPLSPPGTVVGGFTDRIKSEVGFDCKVILPASHDTGSAFLAVPTLSDNSVTISSGTWSLIGVENERPITTEQSRLNNFTNEGGYNYRYRYLKNIMGLWMIQSIRRNLDNKYTFAQLEEMAREAGGFPSIVDVNDNSFLSPPDMIEAVRDYCRKTNQPVPETIGEAVQCVYRSLAKSYADSVRQLEQLIGKKYTSINIVGGGSKDGYLNMLTAKATGLPVYAGPSEGTALGNIMVQMIAAGEFSGLSQARKAVINSFEIKEILP